LERGSRRLAQIPDRSITRDFFGVMISIFETVPRAGVKSIAAKHINTIISAINVPWNRSQQPLPESRTDL
jgi:hypothetical protein